jgi:hypothetical protein
MEGPSGGAGFWAKAELLQSAQTSAPNKIFFNIFNSCWCKIFAKSSRGKDNRPLFTFDY